MLQELDALLEHGVAEHDHVFGHVLYEGEEAAFGVEPRVRAQLLLVRLQRLDDARDAELVVTLRTIQCTAREERGLIKASG